MSRVEDTGAASGFDKWEDDPLADLRDREESLEAIAESDAPDAPVARLMLALINDDELSQEDVAAISPEGENP